ncbi:MAG: glycosyltransferase family 4 protein [Bdellovibrionales bacterium]
MKILIVTDAWEPQVNGVVRTLQNTARCLEKKGHEVKIVGPKGGVSLPFYPEIKLDLFSYNRLKRIIESFLPDAIHIATEGPMGWAARAICLKKKGQFTTAYHTRFPQYLAARVPKIMKELIEKISISVLRKFHAPSKVVLVPTLSIKEELRGYGIENIKIWGRGVDVEAFGKVDFAVDPYEGLARPILLSVGRVAVEKNLEMFLEIQTVGTKVVVGDGPDLERLRKKYPQVRFLGKLEKEALFCAYFCANLFVFASKTDTFGLVLLEACAAGLRIAAYPAPGPKDLFVAKECKQFVVLKENLQEAVDQALALPESREAARAFARCHEWEVCSEEFCAYLAPIHP